jgi:hypothetical protein
VRRRGWGGEQQQGLLGMILLEEKHPFSHSFQHILLNQFKVISQYIKKATKAVRNDTPMHTPR